MEIIETLAYTIFVLGVLIFVHELGHFLVAKKGGIRVDQFSLGFPPKAIGITVGETEYCISWVPLGGYVKVAGMADFGSEKATGEPWEFQSKPKWIQMAVMAAGPAMNFILGFLLILGVRIGAGEYVIPTRVIGRVDPSSALYVSGLRAGDEVLSVAGQRVDSWRFIERFLLESSGETVVNFRRGLESVSIEVAAEDLRSGLGIEPDMAAAAGAVIPSHPAAKAGIKAGDQIIFVAGTTVSKWWEMREQIAARPGEEIEIRWLRKGVEQTALLTPQPQRLGDRTIGLIGIRPPMDRVPVPLGLAIGRSGEDVLVFTTSLFGLIKRLILGEVSGRSLAGPVGIAQMAGHNARQGWFSLLAFMAMLSINLAVLNLLPIPMLDGGHLVILGVEAAIRRPLSARQKEILQQAGFAFLLCMMMYVTFGDISRIFGWFN